MPASFFRRLRDLLRRRRLVAAFDEELQFHLEELAAEYRRRGMDPLEARAAAQREFGNVTLTREALRSQAGWPGIEGWLRDALLAGRGLVRRRAFTWGVTAILAVGLAAAATLIVLVDAVFLRPLPVAAPEELYLVRDPNGDVAGFSAGTARRLAAMLPAGAGVAAHASGSRAAVQRGAAPVEMIHVQLVEGRYFPVVGLQPVAGRLLGPQDDQVGAPLSVAVVSESWARDRFGTAQAALGVELRVNRHPVSIVGVVPADFTGLEVGGRTQLWLPAGLQPAIRSTGNSWIFSSSDRPNDPDWNREERVSWLRLVVRVPAGDAASIIPLLREASRPAREDRMAQMDDPIEREATERQTWTVVSASRGYSHFRSSFGTTSRLLGGIVGALLLLTAANVSNLLLVRTIARHRELGVRLALGSGRWRVVRLAIIEAALLGALGAAGGGLLASWLLPLAATLLAPGQQLTLRLLEWRPLLGLAGLTVVLAGLFAWAPAAWIARLDPLAALAGRTGATRAPVRLGRMLVVMQMTLAVVLVAVAVALGRELHRTLTADPGFATTQVLTSTFNPAAAGFTEEQLEGLYSRIEDKVRALPGVMAAGLASSGILSGSVSRSGIYPRGDDVRVRTGQLQSDSVRPGYFAAVGLTLLRGRELLASDGPESPRVTVVTETFARTLFGAGDPLGRQFGYGPTADSDDWTIVGVVADARFNAVAEAAPPVFFVPAAQWNPSMSYLAVRTTGSPTAVRRALRAALAEAESALVWTRWMSLDERVTHDLGGRIATSRLVLTLAAVALVLAALGVGVSLAQLVTLRRREIAVRMALGADRARIVRGIVADAWRLALLGAAVGLVVVVALGEVPGLQRVMPEWDLAAAFSALVAGALAATFGALRPARSATRIEPQRVLAAE